MTIGRTDDPENPISVPAFEAAKLFGAGSRTPSGPADMMPRQQAGHMLAIDPPVRILIDALASEGPSTHTLRGVGAPGGRMMQGFLGEKIDGGASADIH